MELLIALGVVYWVVNKRKGKETPVDYQRIQQAQGYRTTPTRAQGNSPVRTAAYIDDGILSAEEANAIINLLRIYRNADTMKQQEIGNHMDARILAQFNHLLNSTWNMDVNRVLEYLVQQGRHGRYTALGAYALKVVR